MGGLICMVAMEWPMRLYKPCKSITNRVPITGRIAPTLCTIHLWVNTFIRPPLTLGIRLWFLRIPSKNPLLEVKGVMPTGQTNLDYWLADHEEVAGYGRPYYTLGSGSVYYQTPGYLDHIPQYEAPSRQAYWGFVPFGPQQQEGAMFSYVPYYSRSLTGNQWWRPS